jgi:adenylate cyclase class IV
MEDLSVYQDFSLKARCADLPRFRQALQQCGAKFLGTDQQRDTYYAEKLGKLKWRESTREPLLIHYERLPDAHGTERTRVLRYDRHPTPAHVAAVVAGREVLGVVEKSRDIYSLGSIKIHLDTFANGAQFVEIEAIDREGRHTLDDLRRQCLRLAEALGIAPADVITNGYLAT